MRLFSPRLRVDSSSGEGECATTRLGYRQHRLRRAWQRQPPRVHYSLLGGARRQETAMSFYRDHVYPHLVNMLGNPKPIREVRQRILPWAQGKVLEIGVGPVSTLCTTIPKR